MDDEDELFDFASSYKDKARLSQLINSSRSKEDYLAQLRKLRDANKLSTGESVGLVARSVAKPFVEIGGGISRGIGMLHKGDDVFDQTARAGQKFSEDVSADRDRAGTLTKGLSYLGEIGGNIVPATGSAKLVLGGAKALKLARVAKFLEGGREAGLMARAAAATARQTPQIVAQNFGQGREDQLGEDFAGDLAFGVAGEGLGKMIGGRMRANKLTKIRGERAARDAKLASAASQSTQSAEAAAQAQRQQALDAVKSRIAAQRSRGRNTASGIDKMEVQARRALVANPVEARLDTRARVEGNVSASEAARREAGRTRAQRLGEAGARQREEVQGIVGEGADLASAERLQDVRTVLSTLSDLKLSKKQLREMLAARGLRVDAEAVRKAVTQAQAADEVAAQQGADALARIFKISAADVESVMPTARKAVRAGGKRNWPKLAKAADKLDEMVEEGVDVPRGPEAVEQISAARRTRGRLPPPKPPGMRRSTNPFGTTDARREIASEGRKALIGATVGVGVGAPAALSAQGEGGQEQSELDRLGLLTAAGVGGAGLALMGSKAARVLKAGARSAKDIKPIEIELQREARNAERAARLADPTARNAEVALMRRRREAMGLAPIREVDPDAKLPELGGKSAREYYPAQMFQNLSPEGQRRLAGEAVTQAEVTRGVPKTRVSDVEVQAEAKRKDLMQVLQIDPKKANAADNVAVANGVMGLADDVEQLMVRREAAKAKLDGTSFGTVAARAAKAELDQIDQHMNALREDQVEMLNFLSRSGTAAGRDLHSFKILAVQMANNPEAFLQRTAKKLGRAIPNDKADEIRELLRKGDKVGAAQVAIELQQRSWIGQAVDLINAGRLSGIAGRGRDLVSGVTNTLVEGGVNAPMRAGFDKWMSRFTGERTSDFTVSGLVDDMEAALTGVKGSTDAKAAGGFAGGLQRFVREDLGADAYREGGLLGWARRQRRADYDAESLERLDLGRQTTIKGFTGSEKVDTFLDTAQKAVYRITTGIDKVAKSGSYASSISEQARVQAKRELAEGLIDRKQLTARIKDLAQNPTDEMRAASKSYAERNTFQNNEAAAKAVTMIKRDLPAFIRRQGPGSEVVANAIEESMNLIVPFARTASNIGARVLDYTPIGFARGGAIAYSLNKALKSGIPVDRAMVRKAQRDAVEAMSRAMTGGALGVAGYAYALSKDGIISGSLPDDPGEREAWAAAGIRPNSVDIGGAWLPLNQLSPIGNAMIVGANVAQASENGTITGSTLNKIMTTLGTVGTTSIKTVLEQPLVTGFQGGLNAVNNPDRYLASFLAGQVGSVVPTLVSDIASATDQGRARLIDRKSLPAAMAQQVMGRIPGLRSKLPQDYDVYGREKMTRSASPWAVVNPFSGPPSAKRKQPEAKSLLRAKGGISRLGRGTNEDGSNEELFNYSRRMKATGQSVREAALEKLGGRSFRRLRSDAEREQAKEVLQDAASQGRRRASRILEARGIKGYR